jgi:hypothetical protein
MLPRNLVSRTHLASYFSASCLLIFVAQASAATSTSSDASPAAALVQAALDAEQAGDAERRAALLAEAIETDPEFAPARWHSGQVNFDGAWRTLADVQNLVSHHRRWADYRELRDSLAGTPEDHVTLAEYCREHRLANEERFHWAVVLLSQPDHKIARERLDLRPFRDGLFTGEQIAAIEQREADAEKLRKRLLPNFHKLCRDAMSGAHGRRAAALNAIRGTTDVAALPALHEAVADAVQKAPELSDSLELAYIATLAKMPHHGATLRLLNLAVFSESAEARRAAAESLRTRPDTDYVPLLMAALTAPIELDVSVFAAPDGTVSLQQTLFQDRIGGAAEHIASLDLGTEGAIMYDPSRENPGRVLQNHLAAASATAGQTRDAVDAANAQTAMLNDRVNEALRIAAEFESSSSQPREAWEGWKHRNELSLSDGSLQRTRSYEFSTYQYLTRSPSYETFGAPAAAPVQEATSCFLPGTPVWTQDGAHPIEQIRAGDFVLAQHPESGELAYRAVLAVTIGEPMEVASIELPDERIVATLGHRFWVTGRGWRMAKDLAPQKMLHAMCKPIEVKAVKRLPDKETCYNLVVDEFHTYFVGQSQLLVHDIECPRPVFVTLPGSRTTRDLAATDATSVLSLRKR